MICPICQKLKITPIKEFYDKKSNSIVRSYKCNKCGPSSTYEKFKSLKKRKVKNSTLWMNWRFGVYAALRMHEMMKTHSKVIKKFSKESGAIPGDKIQEGFVNRSGKTGRFFHLFKRNYTIEIIAERKKETIKRILKGNSYWKQRNVYFPNKPIEDKNNQDKVRKESQEFFKSVSNNIKKSKYNQAFFIKQVPEMKELWEDESWWQYFKYGR